MPREKEYDTPALRQAAYRARQRGEQAADDVDLEAYVSAELAITKAQFEQGIIRDHDGQTLARSESYARWRWREYHAGTVASL